MNDLPRLVEAAVARLRADDPLLPVTVVVPSPLLGTWLSREVFAERGHFGIDWVVAAELAWRLAMPGLLAEGRTRVPENADRAVLMAAMPEALAGGQTPDYLRTAADTAGFATAVLTTLGDLGGAGIGPDALEALSAEPDVADPGRLRLLARLARAQTAALADARLVDRPALFAAAAAALPLPSLGASCSARWPISPPRSARLSRRSPVASRSRASASTCRPRACRARPRDGHGCWHSAGLPQRTAATPRVRLRAFRQACSPPRRGPSRRRRRSWTRA